MVAATLTLLTTCLFVRALRSSSWAHLSSYGVAAAAALLTSYVSLCALVPQALIALARSAQFRHRWVVVGAAAVSVNVPWFVFALPGVDHARDTYFHPGNNAWFESLSNFAGTSLQSLLGGYSWPQGFQPAPIWGLGLSIPAGLAWVARRPVVRDRWIGFALAGWVGFTLLGYAFTSASGGIFAGRYLSVIVVPIALTLGSLLAGLGGWRSVALGSVMLVSWAWNVPEVLTVGRATRDATSVADYLSRNVNEGDRVIFEWFSTRGQAVALDERLWRVSTSAISGIDRELQAVPVGGRLWFVGETSEWEQFVSEQLSAPADGAILLPPRRIVFWWHR